MESTATTTEGAPVAEEVQEEANAITKWQRQSHAHHWQQVTRAPFPRR